MNKNKNKGDRAERAVCEYFQKNGFDNATRTRAGYHDDYGDIIANRAASVTLQVKDTQAYLWKQWFRETTEQKDNAKADYTPIIKKQRGNTDVGKWLFVLPVEQGIRLLKDAGYNE